MAGCLQSVLGDALQSLEMTRQFVTSFVFFGVKEKTFLFYSPYTYNLVVQAEFPFKCWPQCGCKENGNEVHISSRVEGLGF